MHLQARVTRLAPAGHASAAWFDKPPNRCILVQVHNWCAFLQLEYLMSPRGYAVTRLGGRIRPWLIRSAIRQVYLWTDLRILRLVRAASLGLVFLLFAAAGPASLGAASGLTATAV